PGSLRWRDPRSHPRGRARPEYLLTWEDLVNPRWLLCFVPLTAAAALCASGCGDARSSAPPSAGGWVPGFPPRPAADAGAPPSSVVRPPDAGATGLQPQLGTTVSVDNAPPPISGATLLIARDGHTA